MTLLDKHRLRCREGHVHVPSRWKSDFRLDDGSKMSIAKVQFPVIRTGSWSVHEIIWTDSFRIVIPGLTLTKVAYRNVCRIKIGVPDKRIVAPVNSGRLEVPTSTVKRCGTCSGSAGHGEENLTATTWVYTNSVIS